jgi:Yip1 domain
MDKFNPMQYVDVKTLPVALQRGLDMLLRPADTWAQVRAETDSATVPGLLLGYALWWVLWAVLGGVVITLLWGLGLLALIPGATALLGVGAQVGLVGAMFVLTAAAWSAVMQLFSWCAVIFIMGFGLQQLAKQKDGTPQPPVRLLQLVVYAMTPVWLLAPLMALPVLGTWAMYGAMGYGLYLVHAGLAVLTDRPAEQSMINIVMLAVLAMLVALMFNGLGWLALIGGVVWLFVKGQAKMDEAVAAQHEAQVNQADARADVQADAKAAAAATSSVVPEFATIDDRTASLPSAAPAVESFNESPFFTPTTPAVQAANAANAAKIAALDKKITKATAQGDMAEVSRLMGERGLLLQTPNHDF